MWINPYLFVADEVADSIAAMKPVVALESTIIAHGMPYPQNVETALKVEQVIRFNGAVPATIAIMDGKLKVGITMDEIESLGHRGLSVIKASRRDLSVLLSRGCTGATTVSATMIGAASAGIHVFVTGGIGGIHRGAETTMDISADLEELAHTKMVVVCAGVKSILDIGLTIEFLETKGVPIIGYQTDDMPAFYTRSSGFKVDYRLDSAEDIAHAFITHQLLGLAGSLLITNPIPEAFSLPPDHINHVIDEAIIECNKRGVKGKNVTPFLLSKVKELTRGESLEANIGLVMGNAVLGAKIAVSICDQA